MGLFCPLTPEFPETLATIHSNCNGCQRAAYFNAEVHNHLLYHLPKILFGFISSHGWCEDFSSLGDAGIHLEILSQQQTCQYFFSILRLVCYYQKPTAFLLQHILLLRLVQADKSYFITFVLQLKDQAFYFTLLPLELLLGQTQLQFYLKVQQEDSQSLLSSKTWAK